MKQESTVLLTNHRRDRLSVIVTHTQIRSQTHLSNNICSDNE